MNAVKRSFWMFLCHCLVVGLLLSVALAADGDTITVGGVTLSDGQYLLSGSDTAQNTQPTDGTGYAQWDAGTNTLTSTATAIVARGTTVPPSTTAGAMS